MLFRVCKRINHVRNAAFNTTSYCTKSALKSTEMNVVQSKIFNIKIPNQFIDEYIWQRIDKWANKTAMVCAETGRSYSYSQLYQNSRAVSYFLRNKIPSIKEKDVLSIVLPNIPEYPIILLGIIQAGFRVTTVNPNYTADEIFYQFLYSETKFVFTLSKLWPQVHQAVQNLKSITPVAIVKSEQNENIPMGTIDFNEMIAENTIAEFKINRSVDDVTIIPYSSGTTGLPKGVELTHKSIVSNLNQTNTPPFKLLQDTEGSFQEVIPLTLPMFHSYGMIAVLLNGLAIGSKFVTVPKFTPQSFINVLEKFHPTFGYMVPFVVLFLINNDKVLPEHVKHLKTVVCSASPIGASDIARLNEKAANAITILQKFGLTEASPETHTQTPYIEGGIKIKGAGLVLPNTEFRIVPSDGSDQNGLGPNMNGELIIRGPQVMKGYYKNLKATQAAIDKDGWLRTGDIAYYDEDGHLFVTDRLKELIKVKGFQVAPAELEAILRNYPGIEDAAVVGIPHATYGEIPKAFIVAKANFSINVAKIQEFVASKVTNYKHLRGGIVVLDSIPRGASGKPLRRELKNL